MISNRNTWDAKNMLDYFCQRMIITMHPGINDRELLKKFEGTPKYNIKYIAEVLGSAAQRTDVYISNTDDNAQLLRLLKLAHHVLMHNLYSNLMYDFGTGKLRIEVVETPSRSFTIDFLLGHNDKLIGRITTRSVKTIEKKR